MQQRSLKNRSIIKYPQMLLSRSLSLFSKNISFQKKKIYIKDYSLYEQYHIKTKEEGTSKGETENGIKHKLFR